MRTDENKADMITIELETVKFEKNTWLVMSKTNT
jgi:hypothetical protein